MKVITWNVRRANKDSGVWEQISELQPDIALLQEVGEIPEELGKDFKSVSRPAIYKTGNHQKFSTAVLVRGEIIEKEIPLTSEHNWINCELKFFKGNIISCLASIAGWDPIHIVSVHSPAWALDDSAGASALMQGEDLSPVKLTKNPKVWMTEIVWSALEHTVSADQTWIVGGDYNSSETFDKEWQDENGVKYGLS